MKLAQYLSQNANLIDLWGNGIKITLIIDLLPLTLTIVDPHIIVHQHNPESSPYSESSVATNHLALALSVLFL